MHKVFVVHNGKPYPYYRSVNGGEYLFSSDPKSIEDGFESLEERYRKFITTDEIEKIYRVSDTALINGRECEIFQSSDDNFDQPDSWITIVTDDVEFLKANNIWEGAEVVDNQYGHRFYHSSRIPVSEVTILRTRKDLPID